MADSLVGRVACMHAHTVLRLRFTVDELRIWGGDVAATVADREQGNARRLLFRGSEIGQREAVRQVRRLLPTTGDMGAMARD